MKEQAHVVRLIFDWYVNGQMSIREVAYRLSAMGFRTHQGRTHWTRGTVAKILANETYAGTAYYNRLERVEPHSEQRVLRPKEQWIPISVPPIVDRETWEEAQKRLAHNRKLVRKRPGRRYLLSGILACAECNYAYSGDFYSGKRYYRDGARRHPNLRAEVAEEKIWNEIKQILLNPATLREGYRARETQIMEQRRSITERLETVLKLMEKAERKLEALTDAYVDPDIKVSKAEYSRRRGQIEKEITEWKREAAEVRRRLEAETITQEQMQAIEEFAAEVSKGIDLLGFEEKREVLQLLRVQGKVHHDGDGKAWVELEGLFPVTRVGLSSTTSWRCSAPPHPLER